ncbi:type II toxin-antitoxin system Phd/YefM family antitoxin [Mesorhizobium sp. B1-1-6]|uniref:type II toxin-antitoxin system Phd/YefM family antitoxin n=1 Tax=Mesorhizobium sp. B1-1-6 TaxID=2589978 RepID=UPI0032B1EF8E
MIHRRTEHILRVKRGVVFLSWQLRDARNNLSKLVRQSREKGPQTITVRGQPSAVVLAVEDYER